MNAAKSYGLSVVMPALNEEENIQDAVQSTLAAFDKHHVDSTNHARSGSELCGRAGCGQSAHPVPEGHGSVLVAGLNNVTLATPQ